jgi:glycosyltransferase involved in cell wall biosynthesis
LSDLPRLLLCSFDVLPGASGSSRRLTEYLKALPDRFSVVVLSVKTPDHSHIEKYEGARLLRVPVGSGDLASRIQAFERAVRRQLESEEYALVHFTDPFGGYALCELKGDYGYRLIYEAQSFPSQELRYTHPQLEADRKFLSKVRRQELFCLMNADLVVTGSPTTRSFIHSLGVGQDSVRVVRAPVDLAPYVPEALGSPDGSPMRLMYLGSQVAWQGLPGLLRGLALAVRQVDVRLTLVGARHPDWQPHLEDLVSELGLKQHVEFQPPVSHDDVAKVLTLADVGVLPLDDVDRNRVQGGALAKLSEYLAAGRPVLAADLPVTRELVPASAGVFYPPGDAQALADRIIDLARDVPRRIALGKQARALAEMSLDAGLIRGQLLDIYDGLLGKRPVTMDASPETILQATMVTGTPTNRVLGNAGTVSAGAPRPTPPPAQAEEPARGTDPDASPAVPEAPREELPLVVGHVLLEEALDTRLIKTEPAASRSEGPPVVMGLPLRESPPEENALTEQDSRTRGLPVVMGSPLRESPASPSPSPVRTSSGVRPPPLENRAAPEAAPPRPPALPRAPAQPVEASPRLRTTEPPSLPERRPSLPAIPAVPSRPSLPSIPALPVQAPPASGAKPVSPPPLARAPAPAEEPEEISEAEAEEIHEVEGSPTPAHAHPLVGEPEEISSEEIQEAEATEPPPKEPPESRLNAWFAQLAHGYCPPEGTQFARHTPPTTFPGRDEEPGVPPAPRAQGASRGKPS